MTPRDRYSLSRLGFSLIEMLVVLVIIGILSTVAINQLAPTSPKAVRSGLAEVKGILQQARGIAKSSGKDIHIQFITSNNGYNCLIYDLNPNTVVSTTNALVNSGLANDFNRFVAIATTVPPVPSESSPISALQPLSTLGFTLTSTSKRIALPSPSGGPYLGFSSSGIPQEVAANGTRTNLSSGVWLGLYGKTKNQTGVAYGGVFVTGNGFISAYFKGDSQTPAAQDAWQRLE